MKEKLYIVCMQKETTKVKEEYQQKEENPQKEYKVSIVSEYDIHKVKDETIDKVITQLEEKYKELNTIKSSTQYLVDAVRVFCYLEVVREYAECLKEEHLRISAFSIGDKKIIQHRGTEYTNILEVEDCIKAFVRKGIGLRKREINMVKQKIEDEYPSLTVQISKEAESLEGMCEDILQMYYKEYEDYEAIEQTSELDRKESLKQNGSYIDKDQKRFYISVKEFKELYNSSDYSNKISMQTFKKYLKEKNIIEYNTGRSDYTVAGFGKVMCFKIEDMKENI